MQTKGVSGDRSSRGPQVLALLLYCCVSRVLRTDAIRDAQHGVPLQKGEDQPPTSQLGRRASVAPRSAVPTARMEQLRATSPDFDAACSYENQVQESHAGSLQSMYHEECDGLYWGQKEVVSQLKGIENLYKNILNPLCWQSLFEVKEGPNTNTWRLCATTSPQEYHFFSWIRPLQQTEGKCVWIKPVKKVEFSDVYNCMEKVNPRQEVAVTGIVGEHPACTTCATGDWHETRCDSWCEDGLQGVYRNITAHANAEYCSRKGDPNCDQCPPLWDVQGCNTDITCVAYSLSARCVLHSWSSHWCAVRTEATGLQPGTHFCPIESESGQRSGTWRKCLEQCASSFARSNGQLSDPGTYFQADCMRFSFRNDTLTCVMHPLHACPPAASTQDSLWISGDILSPVTNETSVVWSEWLLWSSCDKVDPRVGWKKRIRRIRKWGYAGDNAVATSAWIDVAPCNSTRPLSAEDLNLAQASHLMCWVYTDFEEWSSIKCVPECGTERVKTRTRKVRQQPVPQEGGEFLPECAAAELSTEALQQTQSCPGDVDCKSKCIFSDWASWGECRCTGNDGEVARRLRARLLLSGDEHECGPLEETEKCESVSCGSGSSNKTLYAFGGGAVVLVVALSMVAWYRGFGTRAEEQAHI